MLSFHVMPAQNGAWIYLQQKEKKTKAKKKESTADRWKWNRKQANIMYNLTYSCRAGVFLRWAEMENGMDRAVIYFVFYHENFKHLNASSPNGRTELTTDFVFSPPTLINFKGNFADSCGYQLTSSKRTSHIRICDIPIQEAPRLFFLYFSHLFSKNKNVNQSKMWHLRALP